jgi:hypothetical protein
MIVLAEYSTASQKSVTVFSCDKEREQNHRRRLFEFSGVSNWLHIVLFLESFAKYFDKYVAIELLLFTLFTSTVLGWDQFSLHPLAYRRAIVLKGVSPFEFTSLL